jgi:hypothetical protein
VQDFLNTPLFTGLARRYGNLDKHIHFHHFFVSLLQDLQFLVVQILFVCRGSDIGDDLCDLRQFMAILVKQIVAVLLDQKPV